MLGVVLVVTGLVVPTGSRGGTARMVVRRPSGFEQVGALPPEIAACGCDEELWNQLRSGGRRSLKKLLRDGKKEFCQERILSLRASLQNEDAEAPKKKLLGGYRLVGELPDSFPVRAAERLIESRTSARHAKDFETADALQAQLAAEFGVALCDSHNGRSWRVGAAVAEVDSVPEVQRQRLPQEKAATLQLDVHLRKDDPKAVDFLPPRKELVGEPLDVDKVAWMAEREEPAPTEKPAPAPAAAAGAAEEEPVTPGPALAPDGFVWGDTY